ncbi:MAG: ACP S-malonyltransferase [Candidatus Latescibacteria bacterium]|nr:ACP S-malonyltransferase [bacterium]MBD3424089.1 ACP S-malonyltransferase [Candidatus Latescibacterota bacterium]
MKAPLIFPGQGSQFVGMGADLYAEFPRARDIFDRADEALGFGMTELCFEGEEEILTETRNAQPAILLHSVAALEVLREEIGLEPSVTAGHSLGEYSALVAAGVLDPMDALKIVRRRGELMFRAGQKHPGTMAAVLGMDREQVGEICKEVSGDDSVVVLANINCPGQIVISGHVEAVKEAMEEAGERGAKRVVQLNVSGAFHSPLVAEAEQELVEYIKSFDINDAAVDVISNADAQPVKTREEIVRSLSRQLTNPVLWEDSMNLMLESSDDQQILEVGPGKVLTGLMRRIDRSRTTVPCGSAEQIKKLVAEMVRLA